MKINELLTEAPAAMPGIKQQSKFMKAFSNAKQDFDISRAVRKAYKFWLQHVDKLHKSGFDMNNTDNYLNELSRWMRVRLRLPANSQILSDMVSGLKNTQITDQTLQQAMTNSVKAATTSTERGMRYSTRNPADAVKLMKQVLPLLAKVSSQLDTVEKRELNNFVTAKVYGDPSVNDPKEIIKQGKEYISKMRSAQAPRAKPRVRVKAGSAPAGGQP